MHHHLCCGPGLSAEKKPLVPSNGSGGNGGTVGTFSNRHIEVNQTSRVYRLFVPDTVDLEQPIPLVFAFHGFLIDSKDLMPIYTGLSDLARRVPNDNADAVDAEIARLEAEANPLDPRAEERVRRLARLRRDRRAIGDTATRRERTKQKLDSCVLVLENMRLDLMRLQSGGESFGNVTLISERAMALAREVDNAVYAADELRKLRDTKSGAGGGVR